MNKYALKSFLIYGTPFQSLIFYFLQTFLKTLDCFSWLIFYMLNFVEYVPMVIYHVPLTLVFPGSENEEALSDSN